MEWTTIVVAVISSGIIIGVIEIIRDWRNKKNADNYETQSKGLDLVQEFYDKVTAILNANGKDVVERLDAIDKRITDIEGYLNGEFQNYKKTKKTTKK